jgi:hypothetical protein
MKTFISFEDASTAMHVAGIESGKSYAVHKIVWKNGLISEIHTLKGNFIPHGVPIGRATGTLISLVGIDWSLEFEA